MSSPNLQLRLFGAPAVIGADGAPVGGGTLDPHRLALLALLALHPGRKLPRAALSRYLWPTRNEEQARQALNQALFAISKGLGDDAIFASAKEVRLGARVNVDALDFQSALDSGRPEDAIGLFTAPLLDGFELDDAPEFNSWAARERARFASAARTAAPDAEADDVSQDLADPEPPEPTPEPAPREEPERKARKAPELPSDFVLLEPEVESRVAHAAEGPELRAQVPPEPELLTNSAHAEPEPVVSEPPSMPELMTNEVPSEPEPVASDTRPRSEEPIEIPTPQPEAREEVRWVAPDPPPPPTPETIADVAPTPAAGESQPEVVPAGAPSEPVESKPAEPRAKRRPRRLPLPSTRLVVTVLGLVVLGAVGYMARGWFGVARGGVEAARERAEAALEARELARDRKRSIAVMPVEYAGRNPADAALAARMVQELGPMLTRAGLIVAPHAALTRMGPPYDLRTIADSLNVDHVLQGGMQREGERVAFRFRLVNPVDGTARWEDTYRPMLADVPVLQEEVAATVAAQILRENRERE